MLAKLISVSTGVSQPGHHGHWGLDGALLPRAPWGAGSIPRLHSADISTPRQTALTTNVSRQFHMSTREGRITFPTQGEPLTAMQQGLIILMET